MHITIEILKSKGACEQGIKYMERVYPNGTEMINIIRDKNIPKEMLHWGRKNFTATQEELDAYCIACNIINTEGYWYSQDVCDSKYIVKSKNIRNSISIFESIDVANSIDIVSSENIVDCKQVFYSSMIDESEKIFKGQNVTNSNNICLSTMVANSKNVIDSFNVFDSSEIINCVTVSNSYFCQDCKDIKHCMFCNGLEKAEYYIFNKPIDKNHFEVLEKQYLKYMNEDLEFIREWPNELSSSSSIATIPTRKFDDWYYSISSRFWKWVRTLPNFNSTLLYNITMIPDFLNG